MTRVWMAGEGGREGREGVACPRTPGPRKHQAQQFHEKSPYEDLAALPASD